MPARTQCCTSQLISNSTLPRIPVLTLGKPEADRHDDADPHEAAVNAAWAKTNPLEVPVDCWHKVLVRRGRNFDTPRLDAARGVHNGAHDDRSLDPLFAKTFRIFWNGSGPKNSESLQPRESRRR